MKSESRDVVINSSFDRYANNSNYKNDTMIRKEAYVHSAVMDELRRIIEDSEIMAEVKFPNQIFTVST